METGSLETGPSGTSLIQDLLKNGLNAVTPYKPSGDKIMRMHAQTGLIENGFVFLPTEAPWLPEYLHEMTVFPNGRYDDQVDATAQFLDWFKTPMKSAGIFELYRMQWEELQQRLPLEHKRVSRDASLPRMQSDRADVSAIHCRLGK